MTDSQPFRPAFHFTPTEGWINDPNGLVWFRDEWHLFYQYYNPEQVDGMQWGHAVSTDLMHWAHLPPAIAPDAHGQIWSGSAVVDAENSSGLFEGEGGIVCIFTHWQPGEDGRQSQGIAFSSDGRRFETYSGNPVIPQLRHLEGHPDDAAFRDPKVFYHAPTERWIMVVAGGKLRIFSSADLIHWDFESIHDDITTECPDLFPLPVDGDPNDLRWVLSGGGRWYMLGDFDGKRFIPQSERLPMSGGPDFYATQTWSNAPDGRRVAISWLFDWCYGSGPSAGGINNPFPTAPISGGALSVPCELSLARTTAGLRLLQNPVPEFDRLPAKEVALDRIPLPPGESVAIPELCGPQLDIRADMVIPPGAVLEFVIPSGDGRHYAFGIDNRKRKLFIDRTHAGHENVEPFCKRHETDVAFEDRRSISLRILIDHCTLELFAGTGETLMAAFILPEPADAPIQMLADRAGCAVEKMIVRQVPSCRVT
jgi:sucrose-6-phosphate hydrolase SacC (GH32 family)